MSENAKETVYDEQIAPLMRQVIAICKAAGIPVHASFALDDDLSCTTHVPPLREDVPDEQIPTAPYSDHCSDRDCPLHGTRSMHAAGNLSG